MDTELEKWFKSRPPKVQEVVRAKSPETCYRLKYDRLGHYMIHSYEERGDGPVTICVVHLDDSLMPGVGVFGVDPESLVRCGCCTDPPVEQPKFSTEYQAEFKV